MKLFTKMKDGGPDSKVTGWFLIESKRWFSIALLKFEEGSREAFHSHAFHAVSWILKGEACETRMYEASSFSFPFSHMVNRFLRPRLKPYLTTRDNLHMVSGMAPATWALTFRGRWADTWREYLPQEGRFVTLTHGRKVVAEK